MASYEERAAARTEVIDAALLLCLRSRLGLPDEQGATVRGFDEAVTACARVLEGPRPFAITAAHLDRQREWSSRTFGPYPRTRGVVDHIRKELDEILAAPHDLSEWVDVAILALDGAWRAGYEPQEILDAVAAKQARNESRTWPDWRTVSEDSAIEHDRSADGDLMGPLRESFGLPAEMQDATAGMEPRLTDGPMCVCGHNKGAHYATESTGCLMRLCDCAEFRERYPAEQAPEIEIPPIASDLRMCVCDHSIHDHTDESAYGYSGCLDYTCKCRMFTPRPAESATAIAITATVKDMAVTAAEITKKHQKNQDGKR